MKYIDTEMQLADIFTKSLDATRFASLRGGGGVPPVSTLSSLYRIALHSYLPNLSIVSLIMLPCIWLTMLVINLVKTC
jgi:hypothetical protein